MAYGGYGDLSWLRAEGREPGARRKKLAGYLKAANDLRQSYFDPNGSNVGSRDVSDDSGTEGPGAFPDAAIVRSGNEEMMLFPSYALKHVKRKVAPPPVSGDMSEQEYWSREWNRHNDDKAVVDVDVRGWIYTPHRGPANRKHRLMLGVTRQLAGLPAAPTSSSTDPGYLGQASSRNSSPAPSWNQDEETIAREAEKIARRGEQEQRYARRGAFSEKTAARDNDGDSVYSVASGMSSRDPSPERGRHRLSEVSVTSSNDGDPETPKPLPKRTSWADPAKMTSAELATANTHLFNRLKAFMANPIPNAPISAFFYNEDASRQHTVYTNAAGHFSCRAALDFVPTHVRVLAAEKLSATEEVTITSPQGVSLISDIDDTVKHSGISISAREIFRNTFIRELGDLTIDGVREWYNTLKDMGVTLHYVSNSPWQLYPVLTTYFKLAHLPKGSFHLKQYTGMLQGIFEPVAERKKSSLQKIMHDFPDRKFVLVGDSGEADLEVYTDMAIENPGRVLGIFIRDVTTPIKTGYFDQSNSMSGGGWDSQNNPQRRNATSLATSQSLSKRDDTEDEDMKAAIAASLADMDGQTQSTRPSYRAESQSRENTPTPKPNLPPRRSTPRSYTQPPASSAAEEDLIDFSDDLPSVQNPPAPSSPENTPTLKVNGVKPSPAPPPKPPKLRSPSPSGRPSAPSNPESSNKAPPPPRPRKPSSAVQPTWLPPNQSVAGQVNKPTLYQSSPLSQVAARSPEPKEPPPPLPSRSKKSGAFPPSAASSQTTLVPATTYWHSEPAVGQPRSSTTGNSYESPRPISTLSTRSMESMRTVSSGTTKAAPPPPPRMRNPTWNTTSTSDRQASNRLSGTWSDAGDGDLPGTPGEAGVPKKEFLWNQRWARAKRVLEKNGVVLHSWRVGSDVAHICVRLVEEALKDLEKKN